VGRALFITGIRKHLYISGLLCPGIAILLICILCTFTVLALITGLIGICIILLFLLFYCDRKLDIRIKKLHQDIAELEMMFKDREEKKERLREHHLEKFLMMVNNWDDPDKQV
jgi:hypothetical protein